jgi:hypothetical protein
MSRWKRLNDWPEYLERMSVEELGEELVFWRAHGAGLGHRHAQKEAMKRVRTVEKALQARQASPAAQPES